MLPTLCCTALQVHVVSLLDRMCILLQSALHAKKCGVTVKSGPKTPRKKSFREKKRETKKKLRKKVEDIKWGIRGFFRVRCASCCSGPAVKI